MKSVLPSYIMYYSPKLIDSNYSKSSSLSNMSPFGTLETYDIYSDGGEREEKKNESIRCLHDSDNKESYDVDGAGSLVLSESNDMSYNEMSFASV